MLTVLITFCHIDIYTKGLADLRSVTRSTSLCNYLLLLSFAAFHPCLLIYLFRYLATG